jgi:hypothetical protein
VARKVFYSFHYEADCWRAAKIRNAGVVEGNVPVSDNDWEDVTSGGDKAIEGWIADQLDGKSCAVVLIGNATAGRKWIKHEILKAWNDSKGVVGIYIHNLTDRLSNQARKGRNPFEDFTMKRDKAQLSSIVKAYDPPYSTSPKVYEYITDHLEDWVEEAISIRNNY